MPGPGMPPQQAPQGQPAPQGAAPKGGGGIDVSGIPIPVLIQGVEQALDKIQQAIAGSKATSPQEKQMIGQIAQMYDQLLQSLGQGEGNPPDGDEAPGGQGQTAPQEAAGNPGAIPSRM